MRAIKGNSSCKLHQNEDVNWNQESAIESCSLWGRLSWSFCSLKCLKRISEPYFFYCDSPWHWNNLSSQSLHLENYGTNIHVARIELQMSNTKSTLDVAELVKQISTLNAWGPGFSFQLPWQCSMKSQYSITAQYQPQCHNNQPKLGTHKKKVQCRNCTKLILIFKTRYFCWILLLKKRESK